MGKDALRLMWTKHAIKLTISHQQSDVDFSVSATKYVSSPIKFLQFNELKFVNIYLVLSLPEGTDGNLSIFVILYFHMIEICMSQIQTSSTTIFENITDIASFWKELRLFTLESI